jgi:hypothetical protein
MQLIDAGFFTLESIEVKKAPTMARAKTVPGPRSSSKRQGLAKLAVNQQSGRACQALLKSR